MQLYIVNTSIVSSAQGPFSAVVHIRKTAEVQFTWMYFTR